MKKRFSVGLLLGVVTGWLLVAACSTAATNTFTAPTVTTMLPGPATVNVQPAPQNWSVISGQSSTGATAAIQRAASVGCQPVSIAGGQGQMGGSFQHLVFILIQCPPGVQAP